MKKILKVGVILVAIFMFTGCVKMEVSMGINKDKSMDLEILQAVDKSLMEGSESSFDIKEAENQGFLVREYNEGDMQGYTFTKKFENIDNLSTEENNYVSDFSSILEKSDVSIFSIKKGFLKNTYIAKLKVSDSSMSDGFSSMMGDDSSVTDDFTTDDDDYTYEYNYSEEDDFTSEDAWSSSGSDFSSNMDYTQMMSSMEMNFVVNLPYKVINNNATSVDNDGKQLTWNLMTHKAETIDFEFELYNMTNVYIVVGVALVVVVLIIVVIVKKIGKGKSSGNKTIMSNNVDRQNSYTSTLNNTDYSNSFVNSNDSFSNIENNNSFITPSIEPVNTQNSTSNNMFFNPQDLGVNTMEQTNVITSSISSPSTPLNQLDQFSVNNSVPSNELNLNNDANSILADLNSVNFNGVPIDNIQTASVIPEPVVQPQPVMPEPVVQPQPVMPEPVVQPQSVMPEPVVQPQPVIPEPVVQPQPVMPEPVVQPQPVMPEPVVQPQSVMPEPFVQPQPVIPEPIVQPQSVMSEPVVQPQPVIPEPVVQPQSVMPNQNVEAGNNKFFQDSNNL